MRAVLFESFGGHPEVREVTDPAPPPGGVVVHVEATGLCRSDWHGWQGHDPDIVLPHVPGHELAGTIAAVGPQVREWRPGQRVTVPFVCACGRCPTCRRGDGQVCPHQTQPGFTHWGSFAELVAIHDADVNLVALPDSLDAGVAAVLGCRYATAFRAVVHQGGVRAGQWVAVMGCGGLGLAAVQVAAAAGARVIAVDVSAAALGLAAELGAEQTLDSGGRSPDQVGEIVVAATAGAGADVALDTAGSPQACAASILSLRRRGRHVQVGLLPGATGHPPVPMDRVIGHEIEVRGSHGMPARDYPALLALVAGGRLQPERLVTGELDLAGAAAALAAWPAGPGLRIIRP